MIYMFVVICSISNPNICQERTQISAHNSSFGCNSQIMSEMPKLTMNIPENHKVIKFGCKRV